MSKEIKGDLDVCRTVNAGRRVNQGFDAQNINTALNLDLHSHYWQRIGNLGSGEIILPDATTLPNGWAVVVDVPSTSNSMDVKTYDAVTPVLEKTIEPGRAYMFTLINNGTDEGTWHINFLEESDQVASPRYVDNFNATTDWGVASGGYYSYTVLASVHERGTNPTVDVFELVGADYNKVEPDLISVNASGDITIRVPENPDCRFEGRMVIV